MPLLWPPSHTYAPSFLVSDTLRPLVLFAASVSPTPATLPYALGLYRVPLDRGTVFVLFHLLSCHLLVQNLQQILRTVAALHLCV